ncbi:MAG: hypothetical protein IPL84_18030 [Chitinophagaceae bacterium]|nr:hypothetical protein [Chitinophagaceae bacterium]
MKIEMGIRNRTYFAYWLCLLLIASACNNGGDETSDRNVQLVLVVRILSSAHKPGKRPKMRNGTGVDGKLYRHEFGHEMVDSGGVNRQGICLSHGHPQAQSDKEGCACSICECLGEPAKSAKSANRFLLNTLIKPKPNQERLQPNADGRTAMDREEDSRNGYA